MKVGRKKEMIECPECGSEIEAGSIFCTHCRARLSEEEPVVKKKKKEKQGKRKLPKPRIKVKPFFVKLAGGWKAIPRWVKVGVPVIIILIAAVFITLAAIASTHTPERAVENYLESLRLGDYSGAYSMLVHSGGKFGTPQYFHDWQAIQGDLKSYRVVPGTKEDKLFGRIIETERPAGTPYVVTYEYSKKTYDANVFVEEAGGTWPLMKYRIKLGSGKAHVAATPIYSRVSVDGVFVGEAKRDETLADAVSLKHFPKSFDEAVDYAKKIISVLEGGVEQFRSLANGVQDLVNDVRNIFNKFGSDTASWTEVLSALERTVTSGKDFWRQLSRTALHIYWVFGGGDDGSLRAQLEQTQTGLDIENLPDGYHEVKVRQQGMKTATRTFVSPGNVEVELQPNAVNEAAIKGAVENYFRVRSTARFTANPAILPQGMSGKALEQETDKVLDLMAKGMRQAGDLKKLEYGDMTMLRVDVATVDTSETWDFITFRGNTPVAEVRNVKEDCTYTIKRENGQWIVIERRVW